VQEGHNERRMRMRMGGSGWEGQGGGAQMWEGGGDYWSIIVWGKCTGVLVSVQQNMHSEDPCGLVNSS
jgi:hypothetical protein